MNEIRRFYLALLLCGTALVTGCALNPATGESDLVFMTENQEIGLGREMSTQVLQQYQAYDNDALQDYVQQVGERVAAVSHRNNLYFRFTVLDSPDINAFALPGGYIYVHRGLLAYLGSEAELAAVLAHEVGHVTARHAVRRHASSTLASVVSTAVAVGTGVSAAGDLSSLLGQAVVAGYGREHELESDGLGAGYLAQAGYDPQAMVEVIAVLKAQEEFAKSRAAGAGRPLSYHGVFASHPSNDTRLQEVVGQASQLVRPGAERGEQRYLAQIEGLEFGDSMQSGVRRRNRFFHKPLGFALRFPEGWQIENQAQAVVGHTATEDAFLVMQLEDLNRKLTPEEFIRIRLGVDELEQGEALRIDGLEAYTGVIPGSVPRRIAVIHMDRRAYIFQGAARQGSQFEQADPLLKQAIQSFHRLRRAEYVLAESMRIHLRKVRRSDRWHSLAADSRIPNHPESQLRLLNRAWPDGALPVGSTIKWVE